MDAGLHRPRLGAGSACRETAAGPAANAASEPCEPRVDRRQLGNDPRRRVHRGTLDAARRRYVQAHFNAEVGNPAAYDLVINTTHVPLPEAADMVVAHLRAQTRAAA